MDEKIRILFLSATPSATGRIRVDVEAREISERLDEGSVREEFEIIKHTALRTTDFQKFLMKHKPHIVHFAGHGTKSKKIIFEDAAGNKKLMEPKDIGEVFRILAGNIRIVVLNACYTKPQAVALRKSIDFTIYIKETIGDRAAVTFAGAFYRALAFGLPVQDAFDSGVTQVKMEGGLGAESLQLLVRDGASASETLSRKKSDTEGTTKLDAEPLISALERIATGDGTKGDINLVRRAMLDSRLVLDQNAETSEVVITTTVAGKVRAETDCVTYHRIQEQLFPPPPGLGPPLPGLIVIGREDSLVAVTGLLQPSGSKSDINMVVVRGWPGVGKTTLVGVLGRDPDLLRGFPHGVLWTALERKPDLISKLAEWGRALGTDELMRTPTLDEAVTKFASLVRHRQMLLIVDDLWDPVDALPFLRAAAHSKCALIVTTRLTEVAEALTGDARRIYVLPVLSEENSMTLLSHLAPSVVERYADACRELAQDLGYLPLALHVAGRLLKAEEAMGLSILDLIDGIREGARLFEQPAPLVRAEGTVLPTVHSLLKRSTDDLEPRERECFAFLGAFAPKPATFDLGAMKFVWQLTDPAPVVGKLVGHGLLEPVGNGRFQMHELLVKHARSILEAQS